MRFPLLRCLAKAVVKHGIKFLCNLAPGGGAVYDFAADVVEDYRRDAREDALRTELQELAQAPADQIHQQVEADVQAVAADQPAEVQQALTAYLTQVPAAIRRSLRRPSDPTGTTVPATLRPVPRRGSDGVPAAAAAALQARRSPAAWRGLGTGRTARRRRLRRGVEGSTRSSAQQGAGGPEVLPGQHGGAVAAQRGRRARPRDAARPSSGHRAAAEHVPVGRPALPGVRVRRGRRPGRTDSGCARAWTDDAGHGESSLPASGRDRRPRAPRRTAHRPRRPEARQRPRAPRERWEDRLAGDGLRHRRRGGGAGRSGVEATDAEPAGTADRGGARRLHAAVRLAGANDAAEGRRSPTRATTCMRWASSGISC